MTSLSSFSAEKILRQLDAMRLLNVKCIPIAHEKEEEDTLQLQAKAKIEEILCQTAAWCERKLDEKSKKESKKKNQKRKKKDTKCKVISTVDLQGGHVIAQCSIDIRLIPNVDLEEGSHTISAAPLTPKPTTVADLKDKLNAYKESFSDFERNSEKKKLKLECQKTINLAINTISGNNTDSQVDAKIQAIRTLLGKVSSDTQAVRYCKHLMAKKLIEQGEKVSQSQRALALPLARVAISMWATYEDFGELVLAYLGTKCPMFLVSETHQFGESATGSQCEDVNDEYLNKISGVMRLYATVMTTEQHGLAHPHGIEFAWRWLGATLNAQPTEDTAAVVATLILAMLEVAEKAFRTTYPTEFPNVLSGLEKNYLSILFSCNVSSMGPMERLREYLKTLDKK